MNQRKADDPERSSLYQFQNYEVVIHGTVPPNKRLFSGTVPPNKNLFGGIHFPVAGVCPIRSGIRRTAEGISPISKRRGSENENKKHVLLENQYLSDWDNCKDMWDAFHRKNFPSVGNNTNNRI